MDISTLIAETVGPLTVRLEAPAEQSVAIDALIQLAERRIRIFDHDLSDTGWDSAAREESLGAFLAGSRGNRIELLLRDPRFLESRLPRLRRLHKRFTHLMAVHVCGEGALDATDPMLIVDNRHFLHRFHHERPAASAGLFQAREARTLILRFESLWNGSEPTLPPTTLGLAG
jgi:hypothetical protein